MRESNIPWNRHSIRTWKYGILCDEVIYEKIYKNFQLLVPVISQLFKYNIKLYDKL